MRMPAVAFAGLTIVLATASCAHRPPAATDVERARLEQRQAELLAALSARDPTATTARFADDAVLHVAGMPPVRGRAAIGRFYDNVFRFLAASHPAVDATRVSRGGDMAWSTGRVTNVFEGGQGRVEHAGKFLLVWERRDGDWWVVVYAISSDAPEAARP